MPLPQRPIDPASTASRQAGDVLSTSGGPRGFAQSRSVYACFRYGRNFCAPHRRAELSELSAARVEAREGGDEARVGLLAEETRLHRVAVHAEGAPQPVALYARFCYGRYFCAPHRQPSRS